MTFMNVDLPEPDGPMTATNSPWLDGERDRLQGRGRARARRLVLLAEVLDLDEAAGHGG